jgi:hypothetical protein
MRAQTLSLQTERLSFSGRRMLGFRIEALFDLG